MTRTALAILDNERNNAHEAWVAALREDTREWWAGDLARERDDLDEGEQPSKPDPDGLRTASTDKVLG